MNFEWVIDRGGNHYFKHYEDEETGEVFHHVVKLLSEHQGHGSARNKRDA